MILRGDLHLHSCLSPCGSLEMSPSRIVQEALQKHLDIIALTDHNSALNCPTLAKLVAQTPLLALYGIEVTTIEEVHVLVLFETMESALNLGEIIYASLDDFPNDPERFGDQVYVDEEEVIKGVVEKYLGQACHFSLDEIVQLGHKSGGLVIPSHIDRMGSGLLDNLGFLAPPDETHFDALELSKRYWLEPFPLNGKDLYTCIGNSDAHFPEAIGCVQTLFDTEEKSFAALREALKQKRVRVEISP